MTGRVMFLCDGDINQTDSWNLLLTFKSLLNPTNPGIIEDREDGSGLFHWIWRDYHTFVVQHQCLNESGSLKLARLDVVFFSQYYLNHQ